MRFFFMDLGKNLLMDIRAMCNESGIYLGLWISEINLKKLDPLFLFIDPIIKFVDPNFKIN